jgi:hypothetical protein
MSKAQPQLAGAGAAVTAFYAGDFNSRNIAESRHHRPGSVTGNGANAVTANIDADHGVFDVKP